MLDSQDPTLLRILLQAISRLLKCAEIEGEANILAERVDCLGGLTKLEALQLHPNEDIYDAVAHILTKYFHTEQTTAEALRSQTTSVTDEEC
jgi:hypothetical protein